VGQVSSPDTTVVSGGAEPATAGRFLLVVGEGYVGTHPLAAGRALVLGRDPDCEVPLTHPKISRRHARVVGGPPLEVEDLGSTNGIRVGGQRVAAGKRAPLRAGESFQLGPYVAVVLEAAPQATADAPVIAAIPVSDPTERGVSEMVTRVAQGSVSVLITGETGAGKEVLARTIHQLSGRAGRFVAINCATLSDTLLESELFGHERGAFTGANAAKPGLFEVAAGGTVLLDEIGELPAGLQAKLLRALETREVMRLGGVKPVSLDVRFLSATNRDLAAEVTEGRLRRDLYFRVNGISLAVKPLRERREAIATLANELLAEACAAAGRAPAHLESSALVALANHAWPGNVRELRTVMERALLMAGGDEIRGGHILFDRLPAPASAASEAADVGNSEQRLLAAAREHRGNVTMIAKALGTSRSQVRRLAERYGVELERYR
jgi:transcriptional regulator with PAS, ATPase and Fis domain